MKKYYYVGAFVLIAGLIAMRVMADTVNPTSNVLADSANTSSTIVYRDSNGDHTSRDVTVRSIIPTDTSGSRNHTPFVSSTTLVAITTLVKGDLYSTTINGNRFTQCVATGTTVNSIALSTNTTVRCSDAASQNPSGIP